MSVIYKTDEEDDIPETPCSDPIPDTPRPDPLPETPRPEPTSDEWDDQYADDPEDKIYLCTGIGKMSSYGRD